MEGFFKKSELERVKNPYFSCTACGLHKYTKYAKLDPIGEFRKEIMIIGSKPKDNSFLEKSLSRLGIDLYEDCMYLDAINCDVNITPNSVHINCCRREKVEPAIQEYQPKLIILLGDTAIESVILHRWKKKQKGKLVSMWRGWTIPDQDYNCWICPMFDPLYVEHQNDKIVNTVWKQDLEKALAKLKEPFPQYIEPNIEYITDLRVLDTIKSDIVAFDLENTGLKPQAAGHEIVTCSVAYTENDVYAFMLPEDLKERRPFVRLMRNRDIQKIAANLKYEDTWVYLLLVNKRIRIRGWFWDTVLAAHLLDPRSYVSGLKFQTYVTFGIPDYDGDMEDYLKTPAGSSANEFNKLKKLVSTKEGIKTVLKYNALDSIYEYRLAVKQMKELNYENFDGIKV